MSVLRVDSCTAMRNLMCRVRINYIYTLIAFCILQIAMYMEQRASLPQPLFKTALNYCSTVTDKLDYQRPHH